MIVGGGGREGGSVCRTWHVTLFVKWSGGVGGAWTSVAWGKGTSSVPSVSVPFSDPGRFCFWSSHTCSSHVTAIAILSFWANFFFFFKEAYSLLHPRRNTERSEYLGVFQAGAYPRVVDVSV